MKILFVSELSNYGRGFSRYKTLKGLGYEVFGISYTLVDWRPGVDRSSFLEKLMWKFKIPLDKASVNKAIIKAVSEKNFDLVWIEKGVAVWPSTLAFIKKTAPDTPLVSCSDDDMYAVHNRSWYYTLGLKYYDVVFTTKIYNLEELKKLGAKRTELFLDAYDEKLHRPVELSEEDRKKYACDVGFIGTFEEDRAIKMLYLARKGVKIVVWGNGWKSWFNRYQNLLVRNQPIYGDDYVKAINATKINLCFLRKMNRDEVTSRSVEIPACGGFMLGERTGRHREFFEEGKEAAFFGDERELLEKVRYYLAHEEERKAIAAAGRERCLRSRYGHRIQLERMLTVVNSLDTRSF